MKINKSTLIVLSVNFFFLYLLLIVFDFGYFRILRSKGVDPKYKELISKRFKLKDKILAKNALEEGFSPLVFPDYFSSDKNFINIANKYKFHPLGSQPGEKIYFCNEGYGLIKYKTDRFGFRNKDNIWENVKGKNNILIIGDSFGNGACVEDEYLPQNILSDSRIYNLSTSSNSAIHYAALANEFIPKLKPSKVIILWYRNDRYGSPSSIKRNYFNSNNNFSFFKDKGLVPNELLKDVFDEADIVTKKILNDSNNSARVKLRGESLTRIFDGLRRHHKLPTFRSEIQNFLGFKDFQIGSKSTRFAINLSSNLCKKYDCSIYSVYIPNSNDWNYDYFSDGYKKFIKNISLLNNVRFVDLSLKINSDDLENYAPLGPHFSIVGYQRLSKSLMEIIYKTKDE